MYLFNIQGLVNKDYILGSGHLWFLFYLMVCYFITPLLNKIKNTKSENFKILVFFIFCLQILLFSLGSTYSGFIVYILLFVFGYSLRIKDELWISYSKRKLICLLLVIISAMLRIFGRFFFDDTLFYTEMIVPYTQALIAVNIFMLLFQFGYDIYPNLNERIKKCITYMNGISYEIYLCHYMFCVGPIYLFGLTKIYCVNVLVVFVVSIISAQLLKLIGTIVVNRKEVTKNV